MTVEEKLTILTDAAKYDVACTSSGGDRRGGRLGKTPPLWLLPHLLGGWEVHLPAEAAP